MSTSGSTAGRRRWLVATVAGAAAVLGAGIAWRRHTPGELEAPGIASFWASDFPTPAGATLAMASLQGKPLLLNFWATWCPPCVEELPLLDNFYKSNVANGWQVVGLAIDQPSLVRQFLQRTPLTFPVGLAGLGGTELTRKLGNLSGGLPFTVVFGPDGTVRQRRMGRVTASDLAQWAAPG